MRIFREILAPDIPFTRDDAHHILPAMIGCLTGFAALLLVVAVTLTGSLSAQAREAAGVLQVEVPHDAANRSGLLGRVTDTLRRTAGVQDVVVLEERDMETLLKPWLGDNFELGDLPVPVIIDVKTQVQGNSTAVDVANLRKSLAKIHADIAVEDRGPWMTHMRQAAGFLQILVLLVAGLLLACVVGMVVLVARTNLKLHFKTVSLLHMFGATDDYILHQFQWNNAILAVRGALAGALVAAVVFVGWVILSQQWQSPVLPAVSFEGSHSLVFLLLPLFTGLIAMIATRLTVQNMLRHMH